MNGGGEEKVHVGEGKNRSPFREAVPDSEKEDKEEQGGRHGHHFTKVPVALWRVCAAAALHSENQEGQQKNNIDQPGRFPQQVSNPVFQPGQRQISQGAHDGFPPSVMAKKRSSRLRAFNSSGLLYWVAAKRPFTMMCVTSQ